jgi:uncharacterized membrane protein YphA (DoxX/SURF4 family)
MNTAIWVVQILVGFAFIMAGVMKTFTPLDKLRETMQWIDSLNPPSLVRVIAILEFLGGVGVILPSLTEILPWLTPVAAGGLVLTMLGAMALHLYRKDPLSMLRINLILLAMAAFVIYGRAISDPIT